MQDLYNAAYRAYCSLVATQPKLMDTFSLPLWAADEYHADFAIRVRKHDADTRIAQYRLCFLDNIMRARNYAPKTKLHYAPSFTDLRVKVLGYDDTYLDF